MDKELQDIKNALDCITNNMYGLTQLGSTMEGIQRALEDIGQVGARSSDMQSYATPATLGDIKQAIEGIGGSSYQLDNVSAAIDRNTSMVRELVQAVRTVAEIQLQRLSLEEKEVAEFSALPWSKSESEPNLQHGWVEDLEQAEGDIEDASL